MHRIPIGARLLSFYVPEGAAPAIERGVYFIFLLMPALAVIERDAFLPFLHKPLVMTVHASPRTAEIDTPHGHPIRLQNLWDGIDPARGRTIHGRLTPTDGGYSGATGHRISTWR